VVRTTLGAEVETSVTVSGSESVDFVKSKQTANISDGDNETVTIRAPTGTVYEVITAVVIARGISGQGSGSHRILVRSQTQKINILNGATDGDKDLLYLEENFRPSVNSQRPSTETAQLFAVKGVRIDDTNGLQFKYINNTGATQTTAREYTLWVREIQVGE